ncbi:cytochrome [Actinokineospora bangkokensis]|uniref:Cytochrome n=1 Tax=Actinokineospora bangkokensis TaxID=1193682 RepID=A0A1Q9LTZ0_9PSEU|nr:cytochrome [Actinokineospora bangkokensis]
MYNPFTPGFAESPYAHYRQLRDEDPVQEHPMGFWVVTRREDVTTLLRADLSVEARNVAPHPLRDAVEAAAGGTLAAGGGLSMLDRDPPDHTRLRGLVQKVFTGRAIAALEPKVAALVDSALDGLAADGGGDLVPALAFPLPFAVITEMLGMPETDAARVRELTGTLVRGLEPVADVELAAAIGAADRELGELVGQVIAWKRDHPGDDLLTALIQAEDDGAVLGADELVAQVVLLYVAGHETTVNLISNGAVALLRHPEQRDRLVARPELVGGAVEEMLRYDSPVQSTRRITLQPVRVGGREIPPGAFVSCSLGSANHDERFWGETADDFVVDRPGARQHVSFGAGPHHCLGAALARLEGRVAFAGLLARFPRLSLAGDITWNGRINLRGASAVPVAV